MDLQSRSELQHGFSSNDHNQHPELNYITRDDFIKGGSEQLSREESNDFENESDKRPSKGKRGNNIFERRSDIVFKTLLRKIRKQYLNDFNNMTNYIRVKRNRNSSFY